ncbi:helix-turn-helix transcriptional regulator [Spongiactinospora sp. TRM90649]|uniref:helix-turn-helix domain-containing protein n=1 Tax=Spongiactinospora sp. TRM90649 TaxID=3031114 RepID=UPI0023F8CF77|nr:helix-turn-helix transcriptional regulator [Spongiactinospora sp. TRM90649]MDF5751450.1 helix-turn-helix transcriptional regulator [Spongiactinospora sp. TRM90649]
MARKANSPTKTQFGEELRRHRDAREWTQRALASRLGCCYTLVGAIERGTRNPQRRFAEKCDEAFGLDDHFVKLWKKLNTSFSGPQWYAHWADEVEPKAHTLRSWDLLLIPGLLQTEDYARALFTCGIAEEEAVEGHVRTRIARQVVLDREKPPTLWILLDEWSLQRRVGTPKLMVAQLDHLLTLSERSRVNIQVVPADAETTAGLAGSFAVAELTDQRIIGYIDSAASADVTSDPEVMSIILRRYDKLRADALRAGESQQVIKRWRDKWNCK